MALILDLDPDTVKMYKRPKSEVCRSTHLKVGAQTGHIDTLLFCDLEVMTLIDDILKLCLHTRNEVSRSRLSR